MYRAVPPAVLVSLLVALLTPAAAATLTERLAARGYDLVVEDDGVSVFRDANSETIRLIAQGRFAAPPERVRAALLDYERHVGIVDRLSESRILERGRSALLVYQRLSLPVVSDRDMTLRVTWGGDQRAAWIAYEAVAEGGPAVPDGVVRLDHYSGRWQLKATDGGRATVARLSVDMDMGGSLPPRMAAANAGKDIPALFTAIGALLERSALGVDNRLPVTAALPPTRQQTAGLP